MYLIKLTVITNLAPKIMQSPKINIIRMSQVETKS